MKNHNIQIILRSFIRQKFYSLINIGGLAIGMSGSLILLLYVTNEINYNKVHKNIDRIYRINTNITAHDMQWASSPFVLGTSLKNDLTEDIITGRIFRLPQTNIKHANELSPAEHIYCADGDIFRIFTLKVISGETENLLDNPNEAVISKSVARKYFGHEYPVGENLVLENNGDEYLLRISAVIDDLPQNSSFRPEILVSADFGLEQLDKVIYTSSTEPLGSKYFRSSWYMYLFFDNYILVPEKYNIQAIERQLRSYEEKNIDKSLGLEFVLQKYSDIYLNTEDLAGEDEKGSRRRVIIYFTVSVLLLFTALFNYILITGSLMQKRTKELCLKRIIGAGKYNIILSIFLETMVYSCIAMLLGIIVTEFSLPYISEILFGKDIEINYLQNYQFSILIFIITILGGVFPGVILSFRVLRKSPMDIILKRTPAGRDNLSGTRLISTLQLIVSMVLIMCAAGIWSQISYFKSADLGFPVDDLIAIDFRDNETKERYETIKERLQNLPSVVSVSGSMWAPPTRSNMNMNISRFDDPTVKVNVQGLMIDYAFAETMRIEILEGRDIRQSDNIEEGSLLINKKAINALGIKGSAIGQKTSFGTIVGVVRDFHIHSFHRAVPPMVLQYVPGGSRSMIVRTEPGSGPLVEQYIKELWTEYQFDKKAEYTCLRDSLADLYSEDIRFGRIITIFSFLSAAIALLGILGMSRLSSEKRSREIGIRKVMGAETQGIVKSGLLVYAYTIIISALLAFPLGNILLGKWLQNFEFHRGINIMVYCFTLFLITLVVFLTVYFQLKKSASANPVDSIRYE